MLVRGAKAITLRGSEKNGRPVSMWALEFNFILPFTPTCLRTLKHNSCLVDSVFVFCHASLSIPDLIPSLLISGKLELCSQLTNSNELGNKAQCGQRQRHCPRGTNVRPIKVRLGTFRMISNSMDGALSLPSLALPWLAFP